MFRHLFRRREKREVIELFSKYVDRKTIEKLFDGEPSGANLNELAEGEVEYVFALVEGASPTDTARHLGSVATIAQQSGWMVQEFVCNLVILVRGTFPIDEPLSLDRTALVGKLLQALSSNIKVVHGHETAYFGSMGSTTRKTYGVLLPSFVSIVTAFNSLPFGYAQEYRRG